MPGSDAGRAAGEIPEEPFDGSLARRAGMKKSTIREFDEFEPLLEWLRNNLTKDDAVLIKGSHGLRMDRITSMLEARS